MIAVLLSLSIVPVSADGNQFTVFVDSITAEAGTNEVTVDIGVRNNPGINGFSFCVDAKDLVYLGAECFLDGYTAVSTNTSHDVNIVWTNLETYSSDGVIARVSLAVPQNAQEGNAEVKLALRDGYDSFYKTVNNQEVDIPVVLQNGYVGVTVPQFSSDFSVSVGNAASEIAGEEVVIPISVANNPGFSGFSFCVDYDKTRLTLIQTEILLAGDYKVNNVPAGHDAGMAWTNSNRFTEDGNIALLHFTVNSEARNGKASVSISFREGYDSFYRTVNNVESDLPLTVYNGFVMTTVQPRVLESIRVSRLPSKTVYLEGKDQLDLSSGQLTVSYDDGTNEVVDLDAADVIVSGFDNAVIGQQALTVSYSGRTTSFNVTIRAKSLDSIAVTTLPTKTVYLEGKDALDLTGGKLTLSYDNGTSTVIDLNNSSVTGFDNTITGSQTLTVSYGGKATSFNVTVQAKSLSSISVTTMPSKTVYLEGRDALDLTGGRLTLSYDNDTSSVVNLSSASVTGFDNTVVGTQTLTVSYGELNASFDVTIQAKSLISIAVTTLPTKTVCLEGKDALDLTGSKLTLSYNNGASQVIDLSDATVSGFDNTVVGQQTLTVSYGGKMTSFSVTVQAKSLSSIAVTTLPNKTLYMEGKDSLDLTGGKLTLSYDNDTSSVIDLSEATVTGFDNTIIGLQALNVSYAGKTTSFNVTVQNKTLSSIIVTTLPTKTAYLEGKDSLDLTGGKLTLYYDNNTTSVIELSDASITGFDNTSTGSQTLTVSYNGKTTSFNITIQAKSLTSIAVTKLPDKTVYLEGKDTLDLNGGEITLYYNNDSTYAVDMVDSSITVTGFSNTSAGMKTLTVKYGGKTATFTVTVQAKSVSSIKVSTLPYDRSYLEGSETLDLTGGKLTVTYNNGTSTILDLSNPDITIMGFDNTKVGTQQLTVSYGGKDDFFNVTVRSRSLSSIAVTTLPAKTIYLEGKEDLDLTGGKVTLYYDNGTSSIIDLSLLTVTGFDNTLVGTQTLTVKNASKSATFKVTITPKSLVSIAITSMPMKTSYIEGKEALDLSGGKLTLFYDNDTNSIIDLKEATVTGFDNTVVGQQNLTVTYGGKMTSLKVTVQAKSLSSIVVTTMPVKTVYLLGAGQLDLSGGKVTLYYNNDTSAVIDLNSATITGYDNTRIGEQTLTVSYGGKQCSFKIRVTDEKYVVQADGLAYTVTVYGDPVDAMLFVSYYDDNGRFISVTSENVHLSNQNDYAGTLYEGNYMIILTDLSFRPLCEARSGHN